MQISFRTLEMSQHIKQDSALMKPIIKIIAKTGLEFAKAISVSWLKTEFLGRLMHNIDQRIALPQVQLR